MSEEERQKAYAQQIGDDLYQHLLRWLQMEDWKDSPYSSFVATMMSAATVFNVHLLSRFFSMPGAEMSSEKREEFLTLFMDHIRKGVALREKE